MVASLGSRLCSAIPDATDDDLRSISQLPSVGEVFLDNSLITDKGLAHLKGLTGIRVLYVNNNTKPAEIPGIYAYVLVGSERIKISDAGLKIVGNSNIEGIATGWHSRDG